MKSFSQFLEESYLNEEPAGRPARRRKPSKSVEQLKADIDEREAEQAAKKAQRKPSGAAARSDLQFKTSKVGSPARGGEMVPYSAPPKPTAPASAQTAPPKPAKIVKASPSTPATTPEIKPVSVSDVTPKQKALPAAGQTSASKPQASTGKPPAGLKPSSTAKSSGALRKLGKLAGPLGVAGEVGLETMDQKSRGRKTGSALAMGATKAAGGYAGMKAGALTGGKLGSFLGPKGAAAGAVIGGVGGYLAGSGIAGKASETVAGATGKEKAAMATANRQRQAGTAIKGIGGKTTFDTKKNTMTTGTGSQRKTVGLAKTGVVQRGGQSVAGHLAYKGGKAVYKAGPSAQSLAKTSSNPLERIGRTMFAGAYKKHDVAKAQQALTKARQSDMARQKALGVKALPGK